MKKKIFLIIGIILLLASVVIAVLIVKDGILSKPKELKIEDVTNTTSAEKEQYVSPINFEKLNKDYPDIVAWVDIPGPEISYPVFCNGIDDTFYITHNRDGEDSRAGEIFIEHNYNNSDFTDPVTILYGHNMKNETMFGPLENYFSYSGNDDINGEITVYTKTAEYHYKVFSATSFDNRHILFNYDFNKQSVSDSFFEQIKNTRTLDNYFDDEIYAECDGNKIILSTCKNSNLNDRFLVIAGLYEKIN